MTEKMALFCRLGRAAPPISLINTPLSLTTAGFFYKIIPKLCQNNIIQYL